MSATKTMTQAKDPEEQEPLVGESDAEKEPLRPLPIRAIHSGMHFVFCLFGKEYGWACRFPSAASYCHFSHAMESCRINIR